MAVKTPVDMPNFDVFKSYRADRQICGFEHLSCRLMITQSYVENHSFKDIADYFDSQIEDRNIYLLWLGDSMFGYP